MSYFNIKHICITLCLVKKLFCFITLPNLFCFDTDCNFTKQIVKFYYFRSFNCDSNEFMEVNFMNRISIELYYVTT